MTYDTYRYLFIACAGLAALCFVIAVVLFFILKIPRVIGDLTGATAKKAIEDIRSHNEVSGEKTYKSSQVNLQRGKLTDKITDTGRLIPVSSEGINGAMATTKISTVRLESEARESYETTLLEEGSGETSVLDSYVNAETTVLDQGNSDVFAIEYEISFIHTDEVIA